MNITFITLPYFCVFLTKLAAQQINNSYICKTKINLIYNNKNNKTMNILQKNNDLGLLVLRLSVGVLMLLHGVSKMIYGIGFIEQVVIDAGLPQFIAYGVYVGEVIVPLMLIAGFATRVAALILAGNCAVAALLVHAGDIFSLTPQGGWGVELLGLFFFGAVALMFTGGGKYAVSTKKLWD